MLVSVCSEKVDSWWKGHSLSCFLNHSSFLKPPGLQPGSWLCLHVDSKAVTFKGFWRPSPDKKWTLCCDRHIHTQNVKLKHNFHEIMPPLSPVIHFDIVFFYSNPLKKKKKRKVGWDPLSWYQDPVSHHSQLEKSYSGTQILVWRCQEAAHSNG